MFKKTTSNAEDQGWDSPILKLCYPPTSEVSKEVANLKEKKICTPPHKVSKNLSVCLSVTIFTTKTTTLVAPFAGGMKFATQISPLLICYKLLHGTLQISARTLCYRAWLISSLALSKLFLKKLVCFIRRKFQNFYRYVLLKNVTCIAEMLLNVVDSVLPNDNCHFNGSSKLH